MQRPDTTHLAWVTGIAHVARASDRHPGAAEVARSTRWVPLTSALAALVFIFAVIIPFYPARTYVDLAMLSLGHDEFGSPITHGGRTFSSATLRRSPPSSPVDRLSSELEPGESLIAGPIDLARTNYNDSFFYYLFPELVPGTRYIEMDPGSRTPPSRAWPTSCGNNDWLILSASSDLWNEPNQSTVAGSQEPNQVVSEQYCMVVDAGAFRLLQRCRDRRLRASADWGAPQHGAPGDLCAQYSLRVDSALVIPTYQEADNIGRLLAGHPSAVSGSDRHRVRRQQPRRYGRDRRGRRGRAGWHPGLAPPGPARQPGAAYRHGFRHALDQGFDVIGQIDADFSHDPAVLAHLLDAVDSGADVAVGSRYVPGGSVPNWTWMRRKLRSGATPMQGAMLRLRIRDATTAFRMYRAAALEGDRHRRHDGQRLPLPDRDRLQDAPRTPI